MIDEKVSTEECKRFLVEHFANQYTEEKEWKRRSKYKIDGVWYRDFEHENVGKVTLKEDYGIEVVELTPFLSLSATETIDCRGTKLINDDPDETVLVYGHDDEGSVTNIDSGSDVDELGRNIAWHTYDSDTGRNYTIHVYEDGSWAIMSD